ncbi:ubiquitin carboxyl-terminal hydrolase MINDY-2 [Canna indica]|uniref:Ubiquitin carboxyl-terminal hydrolase MINDY-2 n=1 Tax=Canna indica TaxID=4628 RepID=A0AAQ3QMI4_9LILI|nr:ubiquitin carboxyl-terminal hydrolase MINDY-2 [Canna indica]
MAAEDQQKEAVETVYRTKVVHFLGRETPIVLQNDNGPCPLLAICNVLLLRNNVNLNLDASEVSLQKLLSLVAERLIDSNSNVQDKDDGYVNNQQQNISDAIDLLPRLATGIDVNLHFTKINDFEFTRECAIFDLLDIGLYHGWIIDPQDTDTAAAIGSKSYNTLVAELVDHEARRSERYIKCQEEGDSVDFVAATTATLGVPSPSLSRGRSFDDHEVSVPEEQRRRRGDIQEEEELMKALDISKVDVSNSANVSMPPVTESSDYSLGLDANQPIEKSDSTTYTDTLGVQQATYEPNKFNPSDSFQPQGNNASKKPEDGSLLSNDVVGNAKDQSIYESSIKSEGTDTLVLDHARTMESSDIDGPDRCCSYEDLVIVSENDQSVTKTYSCDISLPQVHENSNDILSIAPKDLLSSNGREELSNVPEVVTSSLQEGEPIYEGEECILEAGSPIYANREPIYEGEMVLAEQADKKGEDSHPATTTDEVAHQHWQLIKSFLEHNASQLTIYGLFCLQEGLKERELCVFFRNNHFSTMFKFNGELYLLATDQGYMSQPDLVWEKLNEVNGDTVFMTGNFTEFKADNQVHDSWNEQSAVNSTADYLAALESSSPSSSAFNSDLQLAMALQQQEYDQQQQQQQQQQQHSQQSSSSGRSRLVTGPQVSRNSNVPQKSESKTKEKCIVM